MKQRLKIVIADDHELFREGIRLLLAQENIDIIGEAENGKELTRLVDELQPDLIVTDIEMPVMSGIEATRQIKAHHPATGIIALTMFGEEHLIVDMLEAGADGYLLKSIKKEEMKEAIEKVYKGGRYYCNSTSLRLSKMIAKSKTAGKNDGIKFSEKELEIIKLICDQNSSKLIAEATDLTRRTVEKYRDHIMEKTGSSNVVGIVVYAIRNGIYKP
jgi:DNA-binding NarL/FixJ family response regulator